MLNIIYMNYCKHLKKRKNKPYCKLLDKEITLSECNKINSNNKCREYKSNNNQTRNSAELLHTTANNCRKMKNKSNKLAKMERKRKSVFTDDLEHCYLCGKDKEELHEIFAGRNRLNSIKYNLVLPLCHECHSLNQDNPFFNDYWHRIGQEYFECNIGTKDEFIATFRKNYLD